MTQPSLRIALKNQDTRAITSHLKQVEKSPQKAIPFLTDLFDVAMSVQWNQAPSKHPIVVLNSIKNIISDNKTNPSIPLLSFGAECLKNHPIYDKNEDPLTQLQKDGLGKTIFISDLQDEISQGSENAIHTAAKVFLASDRSPSLLEVVAEVLFRDFETFGLFAFHLMRAFAFQERKDVLWDFVSTMVDQAKGKSFPSQSSHIEMELTDAKESYIRKADDSFMIEYSIMDRVWNSDYVRVNQYQLDISSRLKSVHIGSQSQIRRNSSHWICHENRNWGTRFIESAETIISQNISNEEKETKLILLESLRAIAKGCNSSFLPYIGTRIEMAIS